MTLMMAYLNLNGEQYIFLELKVLKEMFWCLINGVACKNLNPLVLVFGCNKQNSIEL